MGLKPVRNDRSQDAVQAEAAGVAAPSTPVKSASPPPELQAEAASPLSPQVRLAVQQAVKDVGTGGG